MWHLALTFSQFMSHDVWHWKSGIGYQFWSGVAGEIELPLAMATTILAVVGYLRHHFQCHEETCSRLGVHHVQGTPFRTCWKHHPTLGGHNHRSVPLHIIHKAHSDALVGAINIKRETNRR